jgi:hypothetical protein
MGRKDDIKDILKTKESEKEKLEEIKNYFEIN